MMGRKPNSFPLPIAKKKGSLEESEMGTLPVAKYTNPRRR